MRILLFSRYSRMGSSSRLRFMQYIPYLERHGFAVDVSPLFDDRYLQMFYASGRRHSRALLRGYSRRFMALWRSVGYDLVWIEKELFPFLPAVFERLLAAINVPCVVDYDDAIFHNYDMHSNSLPRLMSRKIDVVMCKADMVIAGSPYLVERAYAAGACRVELVPTVIDLERYRVESNDAKHEARPLTIGWMGSPSTAGYLHDIAGVLGRLQKKYGARVLLVGSGPIRLEGVSVDVRAWSEDKEIELLAEMDIGIMPLPDSPWERGKCGYKLIQYMAMGKSVVASPVGVNREIVRNGVNGFLAEDELAWLKSLDTLCGDSAQRIRMGIGGRARVEAEYCLQVTAPRLVELFKSVTG